VGICVCICVPVDSSVVSGIWQFPPVLFQTGTKNAPKAEVGRMVVNMAKKQKQYTGEEKLAIPR